MKVVAHIIRKAIYDALNGNVSYNGVTIPVSNKVLATTSYPFIKIYGDNEELTNRNQSKFISETLTKVEVVTRFRGDAGGELQAQQILSQATEIILQLGSTLTTDTFDGRILLNNFITDLKDIKYLEDYTKDNTYYRAIATISTITEQT